MYHITINGPNLCSESADLGTVSDLTLSRAVLNTGYLPTTTTYYHCQRAGPRSRAQQLSRSEGRALSPRLHPFLLREFAAEPEHCNTIITYWGQYQTLAQVRASPYYMRIELPPSCDSMAEDESHQQQHNISDLVIVIPEDFTAADDVSKREAAKKNFMMHAVHPIPRYYLRSLAHSQLEFLNGYLIGRSFRPDGELARRVRGTLETIGEVTSDR
ncbi:hypothetical protein EJ02DRAFT_470028 [Clathrospora elynae]|uniref:Uncharacterized protein n=1 Tax=Clathrospora elynae TaxID=706981 RepID=A0A6A5S8R8_9PLEO|nr:hypothetical protein EJ02DRAFT_470028 [Clathrospora elynae]